MLRATGDLADLARQTGQVKLADDMEAQARQHASGTKQSPDEQAGANVDIRATGRLRGPNQ